MDRSRQGSSSNHWSSTLVSSTLTSKTSNNKIRLTTITTTTTPTGHVTSKNDDIESQASILDYNNNNDEFDDNYNNHNKHDADEEEEIQVPVDHISRRDEFRIEYGIDHNAAAAINNNNHQHQHHDRDENDDDGDDDDLENGRDGRTMSNTWRRSFSKYGYPGFYSKYSGS